MVAPVTSHIDLARRCRALAEDTHPSSHPDVDVWIEEAIAALTDAAEALEGGDIDAHASACRKEAL